MTEPADADKTVFRIRGLCKTYRTGDVEVQALRGVDFEAAEGEFIVILGPSGSGKSTFLNIIGGLDSATSGEAWFLDHSLTQQNEAALTRLPARPCRLHLPVLQSGAEPHGAGECATGHRNLAQPDDAARGPGAGRA